MLHVASNRVPMVISNSEWAKSVMYTKSPRSKNRSILCSEVPETRLAQVKGQMKMHLSGLLGVSTLRSTLTVNTGAGHSVLRVPFSTSDGSYSELRKAAAKRVMMYERRFGA